MFDIFCFIPQRVMILLIKKNSHHNPLGLMWSWLGLMSNSSKSEDWVQITSYNFQSSVLNTFNFINYSSQSWLLHIFNFTHKDPNVKLIILNTGPLILPCSSLINKASGVGQDTNKRTSEMPQQLKALAEQACPPPKRIVLEIHINKHLPMSFICNLSIPVLTWRWRQENQPEARSLLA